MEEDQDTKITKNVRTCDVYRTDPKLPHKFNNPDCFRGYGGKKVHPLYRTTNQTYGSVRPTVHEMPLSFKASSHWFSEPLLKAGMYRDDGFNTATDKSIIMVPMATYHKKAQDYSYNLELQVHNATHARGHRGGHHHSGHHGYQGGPQHSGHYAYHGYHHPAHHGYHGFHGSHHQSGHHGHGGHHHSGHTSHHSSRPHSGHHGRTTH